MLATDEPETIPSRADATTATFAGPPEKAQSEKELLQRQAEADAAAYEKTRAAEADLAAQEAKLEIAKLKVEQAKLEKEAELEKQKAYTNSYFKDKELDVQIAAVQAINPSIQTIITSGEGEGYSAIVGLDKILDTLGSSENGK